MAGERDTRKPVRVIVCDPDTGEEFDNRVIKNDYALITAGNRYVKSVQMMGKPGRRTHMICVAVEEPERAAAPERARGTT